MAARNGKPSAVRPTEFPGAVLSRSEGYLFDTALTAAALNDAVCAGIPGQYAPSLNPMLTACEEMLRLRIATTGKTGDRWSTTFGPHLLKALALLNKIDCAGQSLKELIVDLVPSLVAPQRADGAFAYGHNGKCYLHAHCYAVEGLAILQEQGLDGTHEPYARGLEFLRRQQRDNGSLPRWAGEETETACDVTAQAGRLFLLSGSTQDADCAPRAAAALEACRGSSGGMNYLADSEHENTWCTAFTLQLTEGLHRGLAPLDLV